MFLWTIGLLTRQTRAELAAAVETVLARANRARVVNAARSFIAWKIGRTLESSRSRTPRASRSSSRTCGEERCRLHLRAKPIFTRRTIDKECLVERVLVRTEVRVRHELVANFLWDVARTRLVGESQVSEIATLAARGESARIVVARCVEVRDSVEFKAVFTVTLTTLVVAAAGNLGIFWRTNRPRCPRRPGTSR